MSRILISTLLLTLLLASSILPQKESNNNSPESVVHQSLAYFANADWNGVVTLMHPEALVDFKNMIWPIFETMYSQDSSIVNDPAINLFGLKAEGGKLVEQTDEELFINFFKVLSNLVPGFTDIVKSSKTDLVGQVLEGDTLVHFVGRTSAGTLGMELTKLEVISLKRYNNEWRTMLSGDLQGLGSQFQQMLIR